MKHYCQQEVIDNTKFGHRQDENVLNSSFATTSNFILNEY